uniref:Apoptosis inhibitor 5 n=1 Tax=Romanomermis culicivorax TaxID=13658 RepID=A0A915KYI4_ROMCU
MTDVTVERLYELCDIIDNADKKSSCQNEYGEILSAVRSTGSSEKRLAAQLIARYFSQLSDMRDKSLDAITELCQDDDVNIRKLVIKEIPSLCRGSEGTYVRRLADILVQLLQTEDSQEQQIVNNSLLACLKSHSQDTLFAIFDQILNVSQDLVRERAVKFLACKLKTLSEEILTKQLEEFIVEQSKIVLQDVTGDEFILFMHILSNLKHLQTVAGRQQLLDIVVGSADLDKSFEPKESERVDQLVQCMRLSIPFLSKNVHSSKFLSYVLENVLPVLDSIPLRSVESQNSAKNEDRKQENGTAANGNNSTNNVENPRLEILRLLAEFCYQGGNATLEDANQKIQIVFDRLMTLLPALPSTGDSSTENSLMNENLDEEPKIQFSDIECLIWTLHSLCKKYPEFLTGEKEELKELKKRRAAEQEIRNAKLAKRDQMATYAPPSGKYSAKVENFKTDYDENPQ